MTHESYENFFGTLANENRMSIIHHLAASGPQNVTQICEATNLEQSSVSHNLNRLLSCQFIHIKPSGKNRIYSLNEDTIKPLLKLIDRHVEKYCANTCNSCIGYESNPKGVNA